MVIYGSLGPAPGVGMFTGADKLAHCFSYAGLYVLVCLAFPGGVSLRWPVHMALLSLGILLELLQGYTGYRLMEGADVLANITGTGLGNLGLLLYINRFPGRCRSVEIMGGNTNEY